MKFLWMALFFSTSVLAWGPIGHRVVAQLAEARLSPVARAKIKVLLGKQTLADVANWPDLIRSDPKWEHAAPWHYVTVEDGKSYDPKSVSKQGDVIEAIERFTRYLADPKYPQDKKAEAVKFLVHFVGDIHQPLHVGRGEDHGGNMIALDWFGREVNLHTIWDEKIIQMEELSYTEYVRLIDKATAADEKEWASTPLIGWAEESMALRPQVYEYPEKREPKKWEFVYLFKNQPTINHRLLQAGVRLAALFNHVFKAKLK